MVVALNTSDRELILFSGGIEYKLPINEPVELPDVVAQLYFGYGINVDEDLMNLCISRLKRYNPQIFGLPDSDVWDNYIQKVEFNIDAIKAKKEVFDLKEFKKGKF
uniref:Uncharacterized protein n=1 Tax=Caldisericum exile TaxID=693075 RepID=A0A7C4Y5V4_9BACT